LRRGISNWKFQISNEAKVKKKKGETCRPEGRRYRGNGKGAGGTKGKKQTREAGAKQKSRKKRRRPEASGTRTKQTKSGARSKLVV
jgi:hypothetical protein